MRRLGLSTRPAQSNLHVEPPALLGVVVAVGDVGVVGGSPWLVAAAAVAVVEVPPVVLPILLFRIAFNSSLTTVPVKLLEEDRRCLTPYMVCLLPIQDWLVQAQPNISSSSDALVHVPSKVLNIYHGRNPS